VRDSEAPTNGENAAVGESRLEWDLNDMWMVGEQDSWRVEHTGYGSQKGEWCLTLESTTGAPSGGAEDAWTTLSWQFHGDTVDEALVKAVNWCSLLMDVADRGEPWCFSCGGLRHRPFAGCDDSWHRQPASGRPT
jgi:hypothetical protein